MAAASHALAEQPSRHPASPDTAAAVALWQAARRLYPGHAMNALRASASAHCELLQHPVTVPVVTALEAFKPALQPEFLVMVMGAFSSGKSTLLNAIARRPLLPARKIRCTRLVTLLRYGVPERAVHCRPDGTRTELSIEAGAALGQGEPDAPEAQHDWIELYLDQPDLAGFALGDSPGFNDRERVDHAYCRSQLQRADLILWLVPYDKVGRQGDWEELTLIPPETPVLGVLTGADRAAKSQAALGPILAEAAAKFGERIAEWHPISARLALGAAGGSEEAARSGLPTLLERVQLLARGPAGRGKLQAKYAIAQRHFDHAREALTARREALEAAAIAWAEMEHALWRLAANELVRVVTGLTTERQLLLEGVKTRLADAASDLVRNRATIDFRSQLLYYAELPYQGVPRDTAQQEWQQSLERLRAAAAGFLGHVVEGRTGVSGRACVLRLHQIATAPNALAAPGERLAELDMTPAGYSQPGLESTKATGESAETLAKLLEESSSASPWELTDDIALDGVRTDWPASRMLGGLVNFVQVNWTHSAWSAYEELTVRPLLGNLADLLLEQIAAYGREAWARLAIELEALLSLLSAELLGEWGGSPAALVAEWQALVSQLEHQAAVRRLFDRRLSLTALIADALPTPEAAHHGETG